MKPEFAHLGPDWPHYKWDEQATAHLLAPLHFKRGRLLSAMENLGFPVRQETVLQILIHDVTKSSEIEGEILDAVQVRSSISRRLGMDYSGLPEPDRKVEGVVEMMLDATQRFDEPLTQERLFGWHSVLFPTGRSGMHTIVTGAWRDDSKGPMQVVSGPIGRETVHFEAPEASRLPDEMRGFLQWFETDKGDPLVRAAIAHLWFVTIHPFDDGNGRIARAITDMALARADSSSQRFYSMSFHIHADKKAYYNILEQTQRDSMDVTHWLLWFFERLDAALESAGGVLAKVQAKRDFWDLHRESELNARQTKVLNLLFEGFYGKLQSSKYSILTKCSHDTGLRDLSDLVAKGILVQKGGGRSTWYELTPTGTTLQP